MPSSAPPYRRRRTKAPRAPETPVQARPGEALVWTDGACSGNPGPGGWAAIVVGPDGAEPVELSGGETHTTNNRMEYTAALEGLRSLAPGSTVCIVTDSTLLLDSMTKWIHGWKKKGWKTASGSPVKNQDLVMALGQGPRNRRRARAQGPQRPRRQAGRRRRAGARGRGVAGAPGAAVVTPEVMAAVALAAYGPGRDHRSRPHAAGAAPGRRAPPAALARPAPQVR